MEKLILHPTETSQWHALLNEAQVDCKCFLGEDVESYLVFLLMRFTQSPHLANSVLALDFMKSNTYTGKIKRELLQEVGDKSLLFSGLFPGLADKKSVSIDYFIDMGETAYHTVAEIDACDLFHALAGSFKMMSEVLRVMHSIQK
jgi:hypothetical protein